MKIDKYKGKLLTESTQNELIEALQFMGEYYEDRIKNLEKIIALYKVVGEYGSE